MQHRHDADRKVAGDAAANLEEADRTGATPAERPGGLRIPLREGHHVFDARSDRVDVLHVALDAVAREHVAERRVLPPGHPHRQVLLGGGEHPGMPGSIW